MIYTYRHYCINTGWMADGDGSHEVKVMREQRGAENKIYITTKVQNMTSFNDNNNWCQYTSSLILFGLAIAQDIVMSRRTWLMEAKSVMTTLRETQSPTSVLLGSTFLEIQSEAVNLMESGQELSQSVFVCSISWSSIETDIARQHNTTHQYKTLRSCSYSLSQFCSCSQRSNNYEIWQQTIASQIVWCLVFYNQLPILGKLILGKKHSRINDNSLPDILTL